MNISYLSIGNEILDGKIINTNGVWLSQQIKKQGFSLLRIISVGDDIQEITTALQFLKKHSNHIIISGGLGPTRDDLTRFALAAFLKCKGHHSKDAKKWRKEYIQKYGYQKTMVEDDYQIWIPNKSKALTNKNGTACGIFAKIDKTSLWALPGVPLEFKAMIEEYFLPSLTTQKKFLSKKIHLWKWQESKQSVAFKDISFPKGFNFSSLPSPSGVVLELTCKDKKGANKKEELNSLFTTIKKTIPKECIVSSNGDDIITTLYKKMKKAKATLATAESCTGGLLGHLLTNYSGISDIYIGGTIVYSNTQKETLLGVKTSTLQKYGTVSEKVVTEMLQGLLKKTKATYGLTVSGIAGPQGGSKEKPVGTVCIAVGNKHNISTKTLLLRGNRGDIKLSASYHLLHKLNKMLDTEKLI